MLVSGWKRRRQSYEKDVLRGCSRSAVTRSPSPLNTVRLFAYVARRGSHFSPLVDYEQQTCAESSLEVSFSTRTKSNSRPFFLPDSTARLPGALVFRRQHQHSNNARWLLYICIKRLTALGSFACLYSRLSQETR